jgi:hypothetical protein
MRTAAAALLLLAAACARQHDAEVGAALRTGADAPAEAAADTSRIARLEAEARALAKAGGCREDEQCRAAPIGSRPCGGPRTYVPYCAASTDTSALAAKLAELKDAEDAYNRSAGLMSTCELRQPPVVMLQGDHCGYAIPDKQEAVP